MTRIDVVQTEDGRWKVMVDHVRRGADVAKLELAVLEAERAKQRHYPNAQVFVASPRETEDVK
jgi:hypothetical protein